MDILKKAYDKYEDRLSKLIDERIDGSILRRRGFIWVAIVLVCLYF